LKDKERGVSVTVRAREKPLNGRACGGRLHPLAVERPAPLNRREKPVLV
jgi:hypothetical protein